MLTNRRHQRSRRAKKAVLLGAGLFVGLQILLLVVVEGWQPLYADPEYGYRLERLRVLRQKNPQRPSLVILGSSRIGNGFDSDYSNSQCLADTSTRSPTVANLSLTGGTAVWQYLVLQRLIRQGLKPDSVIVEILPGSLLSDKQYFTSEFHFPTHRLRWGDTAALATIVPNQAPRHRWEWLQHNALFPWHAHRFSLLGLYAPAWQVESISPSSKPEFWRQTLSRTGWIAFPVAVPTPEQRRDAEAVAKQAYAPVMSTLQVSTEAETTYREIFRCCRDHRIRIAAVLLMPESDVFRSWYSESGQQHVAKFTEAISKEFDIPVVDARTWIAADQFWDGHHLLVSGARAFTTRVHTRLIQPRTTESVAVPVDVLATKPSLVPLR